MLSCKSRLFSSFLPFWKKIVLPTSLEEQLNVTFMLTNAEKGVVGSSILSWKSRLFSSFSAFQKKIVLSASIMKVVNVMFSLANVAKPGR